MTRRSPQLSFRPALLWAALLLLLGTAHAALLAVDYGSEWVKASLVSHGRVPVSIVLTEASKRKFAAAVCLSGGERTIGDEALALVTRYPERTYLKARDLLGRRANSSLLAAHLSASYLPYTPLTPVPGRGTVALRTAETQAERQTLSAEEAAASVLQYVARCARDQLPAGAPPLRDAVITIPPYWSQAQRAALVDAAGLAGLNLLSLVTEPLAAAVQYGIDKAPPAEGGVEHVVFVDIGAGKSTAALVAYSSYPSRDAKGKLVGQFEVKAVTWDDAAGAEGLDLIIAGESGGGGGGGGGTLGVWVHFADPLNAPTPAFTCRALRQGGEREAGRRRGRAEQPPQHGEAEEAGEAHQGDPVRQRGGPLQCGVHPRGHRLQVHHHPGHL